MVRVALILAASLVLAVAVLPAGGGVARAADCRASVLRGETCGDAKSFSSTTPGKARARAEDAAKQAADSADQGSGSRKGCPSLSWSMARTPDHCRRGKKGAAQDDGSLFKFHDGGR